MAPQYGKKFEIRSDSWIDLSQIINNSINQQQAKLAANQEQQQSQENSPCSSYSRTRRSKSLQVDQQHLLIRLRQQSYLNRSSTSLWSASNLSNSIDLTDFNDEPAAANEEQGCDLLKKEPTRLRLLRDKFQRKSRKLCRDVRESSPMSLSSSIGDKLSDMRHSWKHFLYKYQHRPHCEDTAAETEEDRLKMTDQWIARYHNQLLMEPSSRPRSVEISSLLGLNQTNQQSAYFNQRPDASQTSVVARGRSQPPPELTTTAPTIDRFICQPASERRPPRDESRRQIDSSSSTTLVSTRPPASPSSAASTLSNPQDVSNKPTSDYSPTATNSSAESTARSRPVRKQQVATMQQPPPHPKQPLPPVPAASQIQPLLLLHNQDQEYYFDVQQQQQRSQFEPGQDLHTQAPMFAPPQPPSGVQRATRLSFDQMTEYDEEDYAVPADETSYRLDRTQVELVQLIGEGQKGYVFLGKIQSKDGRQIQDVAIKTLKYETAQLIDWLMREAAMMRQLEHPHIIRFIGVCPESPALIAMELAELGELKHYLKLNQPLIAVAQLVLFTFQISTALSYLESKQFVHRDVAARNVLVCSQDCVKLADFGLTRNLQQAAAEDDGLVLTTTGGHYVAGQRGTKLPVRWLAPESLAFRRFTPASDVWMFAVCSWEMFHYGQARPWAHIRNQQVLLAIESGQRLVRPPNCPARLYELMLQCWSYAPIQRPKFRELKQNLWSIYLNERAKEQLELEQQQRILVQQQQIKQQQLAAAAAKAKQLAAMHNNRVQQQQQQKYLDDQARLRPRVVQQNLLASPLNLSYGSNVSGYSTADFSSHNSSRSSSMGSLARRQQQHQLAASSNVRQVWPTQVESRKSPDQQASVMQPSRSVQMKFEENVEQNMKRFQRTPGHMLQKQRSQGSIVQAAPAAIPDDRRRSNLHNNTKSHLFYGGYDDNALLTNYASAAAQQMRFYDQPTRPLSHQSGQFEFPQQVGLHAEESDDHQEDDEDEDEDEDEDDDGDYGADSSDEQLEQRLATSATRQRHQRRPVATNKQHRTAQVASPARHLDIDNNPTEPTYEGLLAAAAATPEVAMIRADLSVNGVQAASASLESMKREQKLSDVLRSLRLSPMKARLSSSPSQERQSSQEPHKHHSHRHRHHQHHSKQTPAKPAQPQPQQLDQQDNSVEQQRQLALHQRLLGHIKPAPAFSSLHHDQHHRRSMNMEKPAAAQNWPAQESGREQQQQQQQGSSVEKVDQSLQILESLISDSKNFNPNQQQQQQRTFSSTANADQLVHHHHQRLKQQLQHDSSAKRTNPAQQFVDFFVRRKQQQQQ